MHQYDTIEIELKKSNEKKKREVVFYQVVCAFVEGLSFL